VQKEVLEDIQAGRLRSVPQQVSQVARDFILQMLTADPRKRPSATALLSHDWVLCHVSPVIKHIQHSQQQQLQAITAMVGDPNVARSLQQSVSSIIDFSVRPSPTPGA
jgi:serine/threonine protein kinase